MTSKELLVDNPPRLVVQHSTTTSGEDNYQWGVVNQVPVLHIIGALTRAQADLCNCEWMPELDDEQAFVITYDPQTKTTEFYRHPAIPQESLVGMLEIIKAMLVGGRVAQSMASRQTMILGPDGGPMPRVPGPGQ